ncbi:MAG TPA: YdeI/OmpD-associated family protein [Gemmatimonadales bacterium]|jgi:uncharacterized protein YdeI (YjbR/CyaY-like superfamily)
MGTRNPQVDRYIDNAPAFASPILDHLRDTIHRICPDVEETIKWGRPTFLHHGILCNMAAFSEHVGFGFWRGAAVTGDDVTRQTESSGQFGRILSIADLPSRTVLAGYIKQAMQLNESGDRPVRTPKPPRPAIRMPAALRDALEHHPAAKARFEAFSPSMRREYNEWIADAKTEPTRQKRVAQTVEWVAEGKGRNWKYEGKPRSG